MALQCKINYDQNGQIDYIETDNGQRSKLFDDLVKLFGGDKNLALDYYALTEDKEFQAVYGKDEVRFSIAGERGIANLTDKTEAERRLKDFADASAVQMMKGEDVRSKKLTLPKFKGNDDIERIKKLNKKGNEDGATFNLDGSTYNKGGLIIPVISLNTTQKELSKELIEKFIQENLSKIGADSIKVGIFKFKDSNKVSIDLNIVVDSTYSDLALVFGKYAGQESLFNLDTFENVKTGADGKNTKMFTDEEFRNIADSLSKGKLPSLLSLSPETSANYANLTEDGEGNFVFYHLGNRGYEVIKKGAGQNKTTSREEATAISRVGGLAMYYPADNVGESMISNNTKYLVKVPKEKVYDFNRDLLNFLPEAEALFRKEYPNQAF
jgi:hypothetical protein